MNQKSYCKQCGDPFEVASESFENSPSVDSSLCPYCDASRHANDDDIFDPFSDEELAKDQAYFDSPEYQQHVSENKRNDQEEDSWWEDLEPTVHSPTLGSFDGRKAYTVIALIVIIFCFFFSILSGDKSERVTKNKPRKYIDAESVRIFFEKIDRERAERMSWEARSYEQLKSHLALESDVKPPFTENQNANEFLLTLDSVQRRQLLEGIKILHVKPADIPGTFYAKAQAAVNKTSDPEKIAAELGIALKMVWVVKTDTLEQFWIAIPSSQPAIPSSQLEGSEKQKNAPQSPRWMMLSKQIPTKKTATPPMEKPAEVPSKETESD